MKSPPLLVHCPDFLNGKRQKQKQTNQLEKNSVSALRLWDKLEIDPHPAIHVYDTQEKLEQLKIFESFSFENLICIVSS